METRWFEVNFRWKLGGLGLILGEKYVILSGFQVEISKL